MPAWAIQLDSTDSGQIGVLWRVPGVEALTLGSHVWLRGGALDDATTRLLQRLPCVARYDVLPDGALRRVGHRVPQGMLPTGQWKSLDQFATVTLPVASLAARQLARVPVSLVPSGEAREPDVLLTDLEQWAMYAQTAPQVRLRSCRFAVAEDGRVLVLGTPLPPLAGVRAVVHSGLVIPSGWSWTPAVDAKLVAQAWGVEAGELWLLWPGRPVERIRAEQLVAATRSAVQQTREAFQRA